MRDERHGREKGVENQGRSWLHTEKTRNPGGEMGFLRLGILYFVNCDKRQNYPTHTQWSLGPQRNCSLSLTFWGSQATSEPPKSWMPRLHGGWTVLWLHFLFLGRSWLRRGPGSSVLDEGCLLKHTPLPSSSGSWESFSRYFSQRLSEGCDFSCCFTFPACWWPTFSSSPAPRVSSRDLSGSSETCPCSRFNFWTWHLQSAPEPSP